PLSEIGRSPNEAIRLAYYGDSPRLKVPINSIGLSKQAYYYSWVLPVAKYQEVVLVDRPDPLDISQVPEDRQDPPAIPDARPVPAERRPTRRLPADARPFQGKAYKVFSQELSWHEAKTACQKMGGHLAIVTSEDKNRFLVSLMKEQGVDAAWLGAT